MSKRRQDQDGPSKRARFSSPTTSTSRIDPSSQNLAAADYLEDDIANTSKSKSRNKNALRGAEGYESDSTDDEDEGVVPSRNRKTGHGVDADGDEDMFGGDAEVEEEDNSTKGGGKGKGKEKQEFLNLTDIEGQDFGHSNVRDEDDSEYDSEEEERKAKEGTGLDGPMGFQVTAFNMKNELSSGKMTADGEAYEENSRDPHEQYDKWLDGTDRTAVRKARRAKREQDRLEEERERKEKEEEMGEGRKGREEGVMREMVGLLERGETVLEGLQRLGGEVERERKRLEGSGAGAGGKAKKKTWAEKQKERKALMEGHHPGEMHVDGAPEPPPNPFTHLSTLISTLTSLGHLDVYSLTRESLQRMLPRSDAPPAQHQGQRGAGGEGSNGAGTGTGNGAGAGTGQDMRAFEYRFSKGYLMSLPEGQRPLEREVFGPFPTQALQNWRQSGAFGGPECENIELRVRGGAVAGGEWGSWREVVGA